MSAHALHWFEIPALQLERAFQFYHTVLNARVRMGTFGGQPLALFDVPFADGSAIGGSIVQRDGHWTYHYDPNIAVPYKQAMSQPWPPLWPMYDAISCPTAVIRGGQSDILSAAVAQEMTGRGPRASLVTIPGVGHAPTFIADDQIAVVERLLAG